MNTRLERKRQTGTVVILMAVMMAFLIGIIALAIDLGYLLTIRTQLQSSADAAAMAATWELITDDTILPVADPDATLSAARATAGAFAAQNLVGNVAPALAYEDVEFGRIEFPITASTTLTSADPSEYNAAFVRIRRSTEQNGRVPTFFARLLGVNSLPCEAQATAAFADNFSGFRIPESGGPNLPILPFALDRDTWIELTRGIGSDDWAWDEDGKQVAPVGDGLPEANLFPQSTGSPGNRGTVDIGNRNNSTADLARQILYGISQSDLDMIGGSLQLGPDGTLELNGDTGISAGMKDELASIIGQKRVIPLFNSVVNPGNKAQYTIVGFAGVRILEVKLTGKMTNKRLIIQPARIEIRGGIPATDGVKHSFYVYAPVQLVK